MKKILSIILCAILLVGGFETLALASGGDDGIMPCYNNASSTNSNFYVADGNAVISASYVGFPGVTTGARITIQLQKRNLLVFWKDVTDWEDISDNADATFVHTYPVSSGTYRVRIRYEIRGSGGAVDVVEEELKASY